MRHSATSVLHRVCRIVGQESTWLLTASLVLLAAGSAKLFGPHNDTVVWLGQAVTPSLVRWIGFMELLLGSWFLWSCVQQDQRAAWMVAIGLFGGLALLNIVQSSLFFAKDCGCWGPWHVHPRWMVMIDGGLVTALLLAGHGTRKESSWKALVGMTLPTVLVAWLVGDWYWDYQQALASRTDVSLLLGSRLVEKAKLTNCQALNQGRCLVMLFDPNCQMCQQELSGFLSERLPEGVERVILNRSSAMTLPVSGYSSANVCDVSRSPLLKAIPTPYYFVLENGVVADLAQHRPFLVDRYFYLAARGDK